MQHVLADPAARPLDRPHSRWCRDLICEPVYVSREPAEGLAVLLPLSPPARWIRVLDRVIWNCGDQRLDVPEDARLEAPVVARSYAAAEPTDLGDDPLPVFIRRPVEVHPAVLILMLSNVAPILLLLPERLSEIAPRLPLAGDVSSQRCHVPGEQTAERDEVFLPPIQPPVASVDPRHDENLDDERARPVRLLRREGDCPSGLRLPRSCPATMRTPPTHVARSNDHEHHTRGADLQRGPWLVMSLIMGVELRCDRDLYGPRIAGQAGRSGAGGRCEDLALEDDLLHGSILPPDLD